MAATTDNQLASVPIGTGAIGTRVETDSLGAVEVPAEHYWGAQTQRSLLHFEDFGASNARRILEQYRDRARVFNDDMQGTGAITLAAILAGLRVAGSRPSEQRVVIFGAGTAGVGIADQIRAVMVRDGLVEAEATRRFWCVDKQGLLVDDMADLRDFQKGYARPRSEVADWGADGTIGLLEVVENVHPTIIVGTSTQGGTFTEQVISPGSRPRSARCRAGP